MTVSDLVQYSVTGGEALSIFLQQLGFLFDYFS